MPDIQVLQTDPLTGYQTLGMGRAPKIISGIQLLAQVIVLSFLRNPGRDVVDPNEGSGLRAAIGQYNISSDNEMKLLVIQRTKAVETEVISRQPAVAGDPTEKLKKLTVLNVAADVSQGRVLASIRVINEAGDSTDILV